MKGVNLVQASAKEFKIRVSFCKNMETLFYSNAVTFEKIMNMNKAC